MITLHQTSRKDPGLIVPSLHTLSLDYTIVHGGVCSTQHLCSGSSSGSVHDLSPVRLEHASEHAIMNLIHLPVLTVWFRQLCPRRNSSKATLNSMFIRGYSSYYSTAASTNSFVLHPCVETTQGPMLLISLVFVHFFQQQILTYNFSQSTLKLGLLACSVVHFDIKPRSAISLIFHHESCSLSR